ncbi:redoxin domain-containing protein [Mannheimia pernigra]|uniref:redoxin domain-containing protein n=1 Tax=Mannheimia pernigra TaxID=111844 RepID=UPI0013196618|nr:redoxin domain-containing protein [Mannheimia pernigra]QHB18288.1 redoxin family protein [Mannheimia pernigra]
MHKVDSLTNLPKGLPEPLDDGACDHLLGINIREYSIYVNDLLGDEITCRDIFSKDTVLFIYPMMGQPGSSLPDGWDTIPGARGCTPQACKYRDNITAITDLGYQVIGLSSQEYSIQRALSSYYNLGYALFSDENMQLKKYLNIPTFSHQSEEYYKRVTLIIKGGVIKRFFYPIFPSDSDIELVLNHLQCSG